MRIIKSLEKNVDFWFLTFLSFFFFLLRLPSLFEPYWYGDEGIYQTIGLALNRGALLYRDIWDNKPPLLYFVYSIFGSDQFLVRLFSLIIALIGIIFFFLLAKKLFIKPIAYRASSIFFAFIFGIPLIEGNIGNAENFMIPIVVASAYLMFRFIEVKKENKKILFFAGLLLGISFLFKIVSVFDFSAFFVFLFIYDFPKKINLANFINQVINKKQILALFLLSFLLPFSITLIYFFINHATKLYLTSILLSNVGYVGYGNKFIIPQGLLIFKLLLLFGATLLIFAKRNSLKYIYSSFILLWLSFSFFNAFFSQRPYPHYLLVLLPSISLVLGAIFVYKKSSKVFLILFVISIILIFHSFSLYWKNIQYYKNFVSFLSGKESVMEYQSFFDRNVPRDYEIISLIKGADLSGDNIFVWGNDAEIYKLTGKIPPGKYTVAYHITQYSDGKKNTSEGLRKSNPKFIIVLPGQSMYPFALFNYQFKFNIQGAKIYERLL